ncbi:hypothetical protein FIBSPDRAFT_76138 [Athelia psychrophila]|uniref:Uncharacterized protein n=1 Tax=Athelia psychrophila TaxID=1759441 RepID=A0A166EEZ7_9AGAM|nr:hypothetical protein FIBSPDRAFT_76138 [Fibularhizoctonia sp. CBS 109695]
MSAAVACKAVPNDPPIVHSFPLPSLRDRLWGVIDRPPICNDALPVYTDRCMSRPPTASGPVPTSGSSGMSRVYHSARPSRRPVAQQHRLQGSSSAMNVYLVQDGRYKAIQTRVSRKTESM